MQYELMKAGLILFLSILQVVELNAQLHDEYGIWNKEYHIVTGENVNVRIEPNIKSEVVDMISTGQLIQIENEVGSFTLHDLKRPFYKVLYQSGNETKAGYMWSGYASQYYENQGNGFVYLKEESGVRGGLARIVSVNYFVNETNTKIGEFQFHEIRDVKIKTENLAGIDGLQRMIQVKAILGGNICEGQHAYFTFVQSTGNQWISLNRVDSYAAEDGNVEQKLIFPHDIGGVQGRIILANIKYGVNHINYEITKEKYYEWNGSEIIEYGY